MLFWQIIQAIIIYGWLFGMLALLAAIYRTTARYIRNMEATMLTSRAISAQAALKSAEAAVKLAALLEKGQQHAS